MPDEPIGPLKPADTFVKPANPAPYIRTFAQDMASARGEKVAIPAAPAPQPEPVAPAPTASVPVVVPEPVPEPMPVAPQPLPPAPSLPTQTVPTDAFWYKAEDKAEPVPVQPAVEPVPAVTATKDDAIPTSVDTEEGREAILARLRTKLAAHQAPGGAEPIRTAAPDLTKTPEPVVPVPSAPIPPLPIPQSVAPAQVEAPTPLRTYSSDFADRIDSRGASTFSVLAAQSDAGQSVSAPVTPKRSKAKVFAAVAGVVVVIGASVAGASYLLMSNSSMTQEPVPMVGTSSLVRFDQRVPVPAASPSVREDIAEAANQATVTGSVVLIELEGMQTATVFDALQIPVPAILARNLDGQATIGGTRTDAGAHPFIVLPVASYERTFAGMLAWEPTMRDSLAPWYPAYGTLATGTSTSTSSPLVAGDGAEVLPFFVDTVVGNRDVRALRDASGRTILLYGYADKLTLIISRDEDSFTTIISRLKTP